MSEEKKTTGAENVRWDLSVLYSGIDDPQLDNDLATAKVAAERFQKTHKGHLATTLGAAIRDFSEISMLLEKIVGYIQLKQSQNLNDDAVKTRLAEIKKRISTLDGEYLTFFNLEIIALDEAVIAGLISADESVRRHKPWINRVRLEKPHVLSEEVESALSKRAPVGTGQWHEFYSEMEADLRFDWQDERLTMTEMLKILSTDRDPENRAQALKLLNDGFADRRFAKMSAQTLNMVIMSKEIEDRERNYPHPMTARNKSNMVPDAVVEALHQAVGKIGSPLCQRYYRLKAALLGLPKLRWSDRNASIPLKTEQLVPWDEAVRIVSQSYADFSPTLANLVTKMIRSGWIDAPVLPGKRSGAFNQSLIIPGNCPVAYTLLNYLGELDDVMTMAHELGHGVHGLLAAEAQGVLMYDAPIAYCETASTFGEMLTFDRLKKQLLASGAKRNLLALFMIKLDDEMNTVVRQISFSNFEQLCHGAKKRLSVKEYCDFWMQATRGLYGADGDVFEYRDMDHLWAYVPHFHRPFYVYGYAFGEILVYSLFAVRDTMGEKFEPFYLDVLRAGGTKNAVELLAPAGYNPTDPNFWADGLKIGLGKMLDEAETLARELGYNVP